MMDLNKALENPFQHQVEGCQPLYIPQCPSAELDALISSFIGTLNQFQVRAFQKTPLKAKRIRRLVYGAREVQRNLSKLKMIIVATDLDPAFIESDIWTEIVHLARSEEIPMIYGLTRRDFSMAVTGNPRVRIGLVGVKSFDGAHEAAISIIRLAETLTLAWENAMILEDPSKVALAAAYYGHDVLLRKILSSHHLATEAFVSSTGDGLAHIAAARGNVSVILWLFSAHPDMFFIRNYALQTPLEIARHYDRKNIVKIF